MNEGRENRGRGRFSPGSFLWLKGRFHARRAELKLSMALSPYFKGQLIFAGYLLMSWWALIVSAQWWAQAWQLGIGAKFVFHTRKSWSQKVDSAVLRLGYGMMLLFSHKVVSDFLQPCALQPARLLYPWNFPGKNTGVGCHFLLQGIFQTWGSSLHLLH